MKINYKNQDLKIINRSRRYNCYSCALNPTTHLQWCVLFCRFGKIWIKDILNSDIFRV